MTRTRRFATSIGLVLLAVAAAGCSADRPHNASFPVSVAEARDALRKMEADPKPLDRPVVVLAGIHDPGFFASRVGERLRRMTDGPDEVVVVSFFTVADFDRCRRRTIEAVDRALPTLDPDGTREVDVVAISMGGLVARHACRLQDGERRLRVRRLFTISTPHRGARWASLPTLDRRIIDMRRGSEFLAALDEDQVDPPAIFPYVRLDDAIVGAPNAAPPGRTAWWVPNLPLGFAHLGAAVDPRILADIARRLRGEPAWTREPADPLPGEPGTDASS